MSSQKDTKSYAAFNQLLDSLREIADSELTAEKGIEHEIDIAEGFRNILHLLSSATDLYLESDPERPELVKIVTPTRKIMGDNADAIYHFARLRGDRSYRIRGRKGQECYVSFTIHGRSDDGRLGATAEPVLADVNTKGFEFAPDGSFELILSVDEHPGNWIQLAPTAASLLVRHYYENVDYAACDPGVEIELEIEAIEDVGPRPTLTDDALAERLGDINAFVRGATVDSLDPTTLDLPFVSRTPNELPQPTVFRMAGSDTWGAMDIAYAMGPFELAEDEALVMEGRFPECDFANVVLWNKYMQSLEYRDRCVSLNRKQVELEEDGSFRIVIAHSDPGVSNWLDTEGRRGGTIFWRFLLPVETPERPVCRVVKQSELASLPA
jgi:hypothetical protein